jgi:hypothetical protein
VVSLSLIKVLKVKSIVRAEEFLRESHKALYKQLCTLKAEYVNAVRHLGKVAHSSRINTLREALQSSDVLQTELGDDVIGNRFPHPCSMSPRIDEGAFIVELASQSVDIRELAYSQIKRKVKISSTRYTAKTAFQMIETTFARWWLNPSPDDEQIPGGERTPSPIHEENNDTGDGSPTYSPLRDYGDEVEEAAQRSVEQLGFLLRAPLTAVASIAWAFSSPVWVFMPESHTYHLPMEEIQKEYKNKIVEPWLEDLNKEGEETLIGVIRLSSREAKCTVDNALEREATRYNETSGTQEPPDDTTVDNLVTAFVNLLAAEEALLELQGRIGLR